MMSAPCSDMSLTMVVFFKTGGRLRLQPQTWARKMRLASQGGGGLPGMLSFDTLAGRAQGDDHAFAGGEYRIKFVAGVLSE